MSDGEPMGVRVRCAATYPLLGLRCDCLDGHDGPHYAFPYSWGFECWGGPVIVDGEYLEIGTNPGGEVSHG
jgi:hypothetical protein